MLLELDLGGMKVHTKATILHREVELRLRANLRHIVVDVADLWEVGERSSERHTVLLLKSISLRLAAVCIILALYLKHWVVGGRRDYQAAYFGDVRQKRVGESATHLVEGRVRILTWCERDVL